MHAPELTLTSVVFLFYAGGTNQGISGLFVLCIDIEGAN